MPRRVSSFARDAAGRLCINPRKLDVESFHLVPDLSNSLQSNPALPNFDAVAVPALGQTAPILFTVSQDGPVELFYASHHRDDFTNNILVDIYDEGLKRHLMNRAVPIDCVFGRTLIGGVGGGSGFGPFILPESLFLHSSRALQLRFSNPVAAPPAFKYVWPVFTGIRYYGYSNPAAALAQEVEKRAAEARISTPYWMTTEQDITIAAGLGIATGWMQIAAEAHFEAYKPLYYADGDFEYAITDRRNGRQMMNRPVHCRAGLGTAAFPMIWPQDKLWQANSQVQVDFRDLSGMPNNIFMVFAGRRIYVS